MPAISMLSAPAGGGRFTPLKPTLTYAGSGLSNMGKFTITNHDATYIYTATGGTVASNVLTVTASTGSATLTARAPKGLTNSAGVVAERKAPVQDSYFVPTGPFQCLYSPNPIIGGCGPGTFYPAGGWGPGEPAGFYCCYTPGYYVFYWVNYGPQGYTWGGSDYTNGQGEWWKIV
jgi:hypothetical protein